MPPNQKRGPLVASDLVNATFNNLVEQISVTPLESSARSRAVGTAVHYLSTTDTLDVWANHLSNEFGYHDRVGREDISGVLAEKILKSLSKVDPARMLVVRNWASYMYGQAENAMKDYLASGQVTIASRMSGVHRRSNTIRITRRNLVATLGREPSRAEIIESANEYLYATRKDPARSGALIKEEDFNHMMRTAMSVDAFAEDGFEIPATDVGLEEMLEASLAAQKLMAWCRQEFPDDMVLPGVAQLWMRLQMDGERVSVIRISNETGISRASSKECLDRLEEVLELMRELA